MNAKELQPVISHSGTKHLIAPVPRYLNNLAGLAAGRIQTLCELHIRKHDAETAPAPVRDCELCAQEAKRFQ
jgi:hypothetical protein